MESRMIISLGTLCVLFQYGCSHKEEIKIPSHNLAGQNVSQPRIHYTTIVFDKGQSKLNSLSKEYVRELTQMAHQQNKNIEEIRVLAWADKEYPDQSDKRRSSRDAILAAERAQNIKNYLQETLREKSDIDSYNMAKRPNLLSTLFKTDEYELKHAFERTGMTATRLPAGNISFTKASKALVIIDYQGKSDDLTR